MKIFIACPSYKQEHKAHAAARFFTRRHFGDRAAYRVLPGDSCLARARATLLAVLLRFEEDWTHFLQVDDDQSWGPEHLEHLVNLDYPLVGLRCAFKSDLPEYKGICTTRWKPGPIFFGKDGTTEVKYLGGGFILWRRDALETMMAAYPQLEFRTNRARAPRERTFDFWSTRVCVEDKELLSEDYAACDLATRAGITPRVWKGACSPHWLGDRAFVPAGYCQPEIKIEPDATTETAYIMPRERAA